jgi:SAM-dependent methyltransferase
MVEQKFEMIDGFRCYKPQLAFDEDEKYSGFFPSLINIEEGHFWFEARNEFLTWILGKYFPQAESFLEIGCGTGYVLMNFKEQFPQLRFSGAELLVDGLKFARERNPKADLFQMDAREIPFENEFDVIGTFDMLEHIEEDELVLAQMYKAIRPGGGLMLAVPQHRWLWSKLDDISLHQRRYERRELVRKVEATGFKIEYAGSFNSILAPLMLMRLRYYLPFFKVEFYNSFSTSSAWLNKILYKLLQLELVLTRRGFSWPIGGSLVVVATK